MTDKIVVGKLASCKKTASCLKEDI
uniref:Uncharacterized protein n=1 Tax=Arundo donax TaxID=35708 RepID=A0A0A9A135_ARUDO